ncbi:hypothetical protein PG999_000769 [Apiospora kogelbergensis]|uniref:EamA domain-containing protein n=1 Tax=Apiospora kogelbergensis TaxID=1337665 RepID=A0AAW0RCI5_9PEZI
MSCGSTQRQAGVPTPHGRWPFTDGGDGLFVPWRHRCCSCAGWSRGAGADAGDDDGMAEIESIPRAEFRALPGIPGRDLRLLGQDQMTMTTRLLETGFDTKFHALQIIFVRMLATAILGSLYMWVKQVPDFPLGNRGVRGLLFLRGCAGFMGLFCSYYSLSYLNISDSTVISFLVPTVTAFICFVALRVGSPKRTFHHERSFGRLDRFCRRALHRTPDVSFPTNEAKPTATALWLASETPQDGGSGFVPPVIATPEERSLAVLLGVLGTFGAAAAYSTIRVIGKRAHSLVSVNYFAVLATVGSCLIILVHPDLEFKLPENAMQWFLLIAIGVAGFALQFLLTEGLQREKAGRATNLIFLLSQYTQLVFALILERIVWGTTPSGWSLIGAALIIGAALWVMLQKNHGPSPTVEVAKQQSESRTVDEESSLLGGSIEEEHRDTARQ